MDGTATIAHDTDSEVLDFDAPACWICLGPATPDSPLERPCKCPRDVHLRCLSRWCLQQAGRKDEKECRFCFAQLPDWKVVLAPKGVRPADPIMIVTLGDQVHRIKVRPGKEGQLEFKRTIRALFCIPEDVEFEVSFRCQAPSTSDTIQLEGMSSFDAVTHCASLAAAQRLAAGRSGRNSSSRNQTRATEAAAAAAGPSCTAGMSGVRVTDSCSQRAQPHLAGSSRTQASGPAADVQGLGHGFFPSHSSMYSQQQQGVVPMGMQAAARPAGLQGPFTGLPYGNSTPFCSLGHQCSYPPGYLPSQPVSGAPSGVPQSAAVHVVSGAVPQAPRQHYNSSTSAGHHQLHVGPLPSSSSSSAAAAAAPFPSSIFATASALAGAALAAGSHLFGGTTDVPPLPVQQYCMGGTTRQHSLLSSFSTQSHMSTVGAPMQSAWSHSLGSHSLGSESLLSCGPLIPSSPSASSHAGATDMSVGLHAQLLGNAAQLRKQQYKALRAMDSSTDLAHVGADVHDSTGCGVAARQVKQRRHTIDAPPATSDPMHMETATEASAPRRSPRMLAAAK